MCIFSGSHDKWQFDVCFKNLLVDLTVFSTLPFLLLSHEEKTPQVVITSSNVCLVFLELMDSFYVIFFPSCFQLEK